MSDIPRKKANISFREKKKSSTLTVFEKITFTFFSV
jgi:hypothetical protein